MDTYCLHEFWLVRVYRSIRFQAERSQKRRSITSKFSGERHDTRCRWNQYNVKQTIWSRCVIMMFSNLRYEREKLFCNFVANQIYLRTSYESDHQHQNQHQFQPNHLKRLCPPRHTPRKLQHHAHRVHHAPNHLRQHPLHLPQLRNQKNRNHRIKVSYSTYCSKNRIY